MENVIKGEHKHAAGIKTPRLWKSRYAFHQQPVLVGIMRWVDGGALAATSVLTVLLARDHLSREQAATLAAADLVAVLTFFLICHIGNHHVSNQLG